MDPDELRDELQGIAGRAPRGDAGARVAVVKRGRRMLRNRRIAQAGSSLVAVLVLVGGVAWWRSGDGSGSSAVVETPSTKVVPTVPSTVGRVTTTTAVIPAPTSSASSSTSTTVPVRSGGVIAVEPGYAFASPVVSGAALFAVESKVGHGTDGAARVVRVDLSTGKVDLGVDEPGASTLAIAGNELAVGIGSGLGGPFGTPAISRVAWFDLTDLRARGSVTLPSVGANGLVSAAGSVWALSGDKVLRVRSTSSTSVAVAIPPSNPGRTLAVSDDGAHVYVGWSTAAQVDGVGEFDAVTGRTLHENAHVGGGPANVGPTLTYAGTRLWATFPTGTEASAVALKASNLTPTGETVNGPNSLAIAPVGEIVWASRSATLDCVDLRGTTRASHPIEGGVLSAPVPTAAAVYVVTDQGIAAVAPDAACPGAP